MSQFYCETNEFIHGIISNNDMRGDEIDMRLSIYADYLEEHQHTRLLYDGLSPWEYIRKYKTLYQMRLSDLMRDNDQLVFANPKKPSGEPSCYSEYSPYLDMWYVRNLEGHKETEEFTHTFRNDGVLRGLARLRFWHPSFSSVLCYRVNHFDTMVINQAMRHIKSFRSLVNYQHEPRSYFDVMYRSTKYYGFPNLRDEVRWERYRRYVSCGSSNEVIKKSMPVLCGEMLNMTSYERYAMFSTNSMVIPVSLKFDPTCDSPEIAGKIICDYKHSDEDQRFGDDTVFSVKARVFGDRL